ncbi:ABC transporter permease [Aciditerrimonas ferrireducens]|uniref:Transport permease protein n=1 Tax=Aciditerrimonas ferrireducens TaxID=667306 RepID=A0ABV6C0K5_9ACTN|nr:ABC transporter permease [Aciditerrimonas ferrireducens]MCK4177787.1 ABC transporter permease [Aciditerrimonas ferrireducens]
MTRTFLALLARDLRVLRSTFPVFVIRVVMQPLLLVFVFTYVFPKIGQAIGGSGSTTSFSTVLIAGVVALSIIFQGIQGVALNLVQEFGYTKEIEDRVLAPLPIWAVAAEKVVAAALQGLVAAAVVFPVAAFVPATPVHLSVDWPVLVTLAPLAALCAGALGLAIGTLIPPQQVALIFAIIVLPLTFLGAIYYPWQALHPIAWLQYLVLVNPLVYMSEGFRAALTAGVPHMALLWVYLAVVGFGALLWAIGLWGFRRRVLS